jgi:hypothetical protein
VDGERAAGASSRAAPGRGRGQHRPVAELIDAKRERAAVETGRPKTKAGRRVVSELIGHASVAITLDRYGHLFPAALDDAAAAFAAYLERADSQTRIRQAAGPISRSDRDTPFPSAEVLP